MNWTVVKFMKDQSVEAVPTNWITGSECYWPDEKVERAIKSCQTPGKQWKLYRISKFKGATYGKF